MKKLLFPVLALASLSGLAQTKTIENVTKVDVRGSGAIVNKNHGVDGYFMYYVADKLKKGDNLIFAAFGGGFTWGAIYLKWAYDKK